MVKKFVLPVLVTIMVYKLLVTIPVAQAQADVQLMQIFILLTPTQSAMLNLSQLQNIIKNNGGHVTHTFPYQAVIASVPVGVVQQLADLPAVAKVLTGPVELSEMDLYGPNARSYAGVWNSLVAPQPQKMDNQPGALDHHNDEHNDAFLAPDLPAGDQPGIAAAGSVTPGYYQTSEFMAGSVAVGIVLVESTGAIDPSTENWTADEKQLVFNEIVAALNWWAKQNPAANLSFVYDDHFSTPLPTGVEPITRPYAHQQYWIGDAMAALGYNNASSYFTKVRDYNNAIRAAYQTDWAFTIFVVDSSTDADNRFSDGYFAYAYLGGPFTVMTYGNNGYGPHNMDAVAAHEIGHIFLALDQYSSAYQPCTRHSGYLHVENQNSQYGGCALNTTSIMRGQIYPYTAGVIDPYAAGQIGWRDSDGDNIIDPLDTALPVTINTFSQEDNRVSVSGTASIMPYPSPSRASVTINKLANVQYRLDGSNWQPATATDGDFDSTTESYQFEVIIPTPGQHILEIAAFDSAGNMSDTFATQSINIFDPVDGGLNTEFDPSSQTLTANGAVTTISGVAYHLQNGKVAKVEYRTNGGSWQAASAQDGLFDSSYEPFILSVNTQELGAGTHLVEARATDADGNTEVNVASRQIEVTDSQPSVLYVPIVIRNM